MPIYEYRCEDCGTKFEKLVRRMGQADGLECPSCGKQHLKQELSVFAAHADGSTKSGKAGDGPMCPSGGPCRMPDVCGMN